MFSQRQYIWSIAEYKFKLLNGNLEQRIEQCLSPDNLPLEQIWKFERKSRNYINLYYKISNEDKNTNYTYAELESRRKMEKQYRSHHGVILTERLFLKETQSPIPVDKSI
jgi:hypothetical protein